MLSIIEVRNVQGSLLTLPLSDISDGIVLADVGGMDPVKATVVSSSFALQDGTQYHSAKRGERNLTFQLDLEPDYVTQTVYDLRQRLYDYFMTKSQVTLTFIMSNGLEVDISGRVEDCSSPPFTKEPKMNVSILCFDPDFVNMTPIVFSGNSTALTTESNIAYGGSSEAGFVFVLNVNRSLSEFTFYHRPPDGTIRSMEFAGSLLSGDVLTISTIPGSKYATLNRSGSVTSVVNNISPQSSWTELFKGDNHIRVYAEGAAIPYTITYNTRYGGL